MWKRWNRGGDALIKYFVIFYIRLCAEVVFCAGVSYSFVPVCCSGEVRRVEGCEARCWGAWGELRSGCDGAGRCSDSCL